VAAAAEAELVLVCAYDPVSARDAARLTLTLGDVREHQVRGKAAADETLKESVAEINTDRVRLVRQVAVEAEDPAEGILEAARQPGADLIIAGNRGLNALAGHLLGSVPGEVAHKAACDLLIMQTTEVAAEERLSA
jgi:nucleotide-binding universal stress UspA family protein